jgi:hypothetical protein
LIRTPTSESCAADLILQHFQTASTLIAELGLDMAQFPDARMLVKAR